MFSLSSAYDSTAKDEILLNWTRKTDLPAALPILLATEGGTVLDGREQQGKREETEICLSGTVLNTTQGLDPGRVALKLL